MAGPTVAAGNYRLYRRQRWEAQTKRWRRLWRIYYRSAYGKAGFWILMVYAVLTLLSPVLTFHNPFFFFAPQEDSSSPSVEVDLHLPFPVSVNGTPLPPSAVSISSQGSYVLYVVAANGSVDAVGLGATPTTPAGAILPIFDPHFPSGAAVVGGGVVPFASYATFIGSFTFQYSEYAVVGARTAANSSEIALAHIEWTGSNGPGDGTPYATGETSIALNGSLVGPPVTNALAFPVLPPWGPFASSQAYTSSGLEPGYIFAVTHVGSAYDLSAYDTVPLQRIWSVRLPGASAPGSPVYLGTYFAPPDTAVRTSVMIAQGSELLDLNATDGALRWSTNFTAPVNTAVAPVIPQDYQITRLNTSDDAFLALSGSPAQLVAVALGNGSASLVTNVPAPVEGIATTLGDSGYPTYLAIETYSRVYFLSEANLTATSGDSFPLPTGFDASSNDPVYNPSANLMILTSNAGESIAVSPTLGADPAPWTYRPSPAPSSVSAPIQIQNAETGRVSIAYTTSSGVLQVLATVGTDHNPFPPELTSPSGNVYLFGTNSFGNDVWSQFIASFPVDWEIGLAVAAGIMILALVVAMYIGYVGNWLATVVETLTLVLFLLPGLAVLIVVAAILSPNLVNLILILTVLGWPFTAFTLIGVVRSVRSRTFIEAAKVSGAGTLQILRRHMLPNMTPLLAYLTALSIGGAATAVSTLQFLGIAPLTVETWGAMLQPIFDNFNYAVQAPWWIWPPTIALTMFVFAFVFVSRGLDEVVNPRLRSR